MPTYTINGVKYTSATELSDVDLEELAGNTQQQETLPDVRNATMAETGGGAAVGMPRRGRAAEVQPVTPLEATAQGVFKGVINPALAATQLVGGQGGRDYVQGIQEQYAQTRKEAGMSGFDVPELVGAVANPLNRLLPASGFVGGAIGAASQPLEGKDLSTWDILTGKATQLAGGAIMGRLAENVISGLTPTLKDGAAELIAKGVPVSPGQAYTGAPGWLFRQMESLGLGPKVDSINKAFNPIVANEVLSTIDKTVPKTVKAGQQSVAYAQSQISKFYDDSLAGLGKNVFDSEYKQTMGDILKVASQDIPDEKTRKVLINSLNANIGSRVKKDGISGEGIKDLQEWLKAQVGKYQSATGINEIGLKTAYSDTLANLNQFVSRIDIDGNIAKADAAWAKLYGFADASKKATTKGGVFNPEQLSQAVVAQAPTVLVAGGGKAPLNELAQSALGVLGKQEPATGLGKLMLASKVATGFATTWAAPMVAIPILTASGMTYAAAKQLMKNPSATRIAIKNALEKNPGLFGTAGADLYNQINSEEAAQVQ